MKGLHKKEVILFLENKEQPADAQADETFRCTLLR